MAIMDIDKTVDASNKICKSITQSTEVQVEDKRYSLPSIFDYYGDDLTPLLGENIGNILDEEFQKVQAKETFYLESPPTLNLGYQEDLNVYLLKANSIIDNKRAFELNQYDGDTMSFKLDSIVDNANGFTLNGKHYKSFLEYVYSRNATKKDETFGMRFLGVNAPELPHYFVAPINKDLIKEIKYSSNSILWNSYIYEKNKDRIEGFTYKFVELDGIMHEIVNTNYEVPYTLKPNCYGCLIVQKDDSVKSTYNTAIKAKELLKELLEDAKDIRLMIDMNIISQQSKFEKQDDFFSDFLKVLNNPIDTCRHLWNEYFKEEIISSYRGFNCFGMDKYRRFLGTIFIKNKKDAWINVTKYLIANTDNSYEVMPVYSQTGESLINYNFSAKAFKLWTYNYDDMYVADALQEISKLDDRKKIQEAIYGPGSFDSMKEYSILLGDSLLMYPPSQIRTSNETSSVRVPNMRSKASITKSTPKSTKYIELDLIFNGNEAINGIPIIQKTPSGKHQTYYMNGLRSLIAQFKLCPFLPIENQYINETLNIEAVTMKNISISTLPNFPNTIKATITLEEFNYRVYMPEIVSPKLRSENYNMFASTICFPLMRFYYQRMLQKGDKLRNSNLDTQSYINETLGEKTALLPYSEANNKSYLDFYMLDHDQLSQKLDVKLKSEKMPISDRITLSKGMKSFMKKVSQNVEVIFNDGIQKDIRTIMHKISDVELGAGDKMSNIEVNPLPSKTLKRSRLDSMYADFKVSDAINTITTMLNKKCLYISSVEVVEKYSSEHGIHWKFYMYPSTDLSTFDRKDCIQYIYNSMDEELDNHNEEVLSAMLNDGLFIIEIVKNNDSYELNTNGIGFKILQNFGKYDNQQEYVEDLYDSTMSATKTSFKFNKMSIARPDVTIVSQQVVMKNNYAKISTQFQDSNAPQFMGGQDMSLQIDIQTQNKGFVALLNQLPTIASQYLKRFRKVLNVFPVRIRSQFSDLFGINEVTIETVNTSTVPGFPDLYQVSIICVSVDRTQRNKESLKQINDSYNFGKKEGLDVKNYFDLKPMISKTELYPDLELPTLTELEQEGYRFIRYANNLNYRVYPDPDFYFVYGYKLGHEIFRKTLLDLINKEFLDTMDINIKDEFGGTATFSTDIDKAIIMNDKVLDKKFFSGLPNAQKRIEERRKEIKDAIAKNNVGNFSKLTEQTYKTERDLMYGASLSEASSKIIISNKIKSYYNSEIPSNSIMYNKQIKPKEEDIISLIDKELSNPLLGDFDGGSMSKEYYDYKNNSYYANSEVFTITPQEKEDFANSRKRYELGFLKSGMMKDSEMLIPKSTDEEHKYVVQRITDFVDDCYFADNGVMHKIIKELGYFETSNAKYILPEELKNYRKDIINLYVADAISTSALAPYSSTSNTKWKARYASYTDYIDVNGTPKKVGVPLAEIHDGQEVRMPNDLQDAVDNGNKLGTFAISKYDKETIYRLSGISPKTKKSNYFLDPYYMDNENELDLENYKRAILLDPYFGAYATTRIMLIHIKDLLNKNLYLTVADIKQAQIKQLQGQSISVAFHASRTAAKRNDKEVQLEAEKDKKKVEVLVENSKTFLGKIFDLLLIAGDERNYFKKCIENHRYVDYVNTFKNSNESRVKKFKNALIALGLLEDINNIGVDPYIQQEFTDFMESFYIDAANRPEIYLQHSFYDMMRHDKRGRMLRAFPTYYFVLIDEGREISQWKLHDNFYNTSAISSIDVLKSRKIAADTCTIQLSNLFKTYSQSEQETESKVDWRDVISSIYAPYSYVLREEHRRASQKKRTSAKLVPGIRVHLRGGYGSNASDLPILFNGNISEVGSGEQIQIIAQGDGRELVNPLMSQNTVEDIQHNDKFRINKWMANWVTQGATPKTILSSLLTDTGTWGQNLIREFTNGLFFNHNPYGIAHFGDNHFNKSNGGIFTKGETVQNIYESNIDPSLGESNEFRSNLVDYYALQSAPKISAQLYGKSFWDIMHMCRAASMDYVTSVVPFGLRSSIFFGKPRYYMAYDYDKVIDKHGAEFIIEKRKPFQQYHIITSYSDIIANKIKATNKNINTVAIGTYKSEGWLGRGKTKQVGPLFIDFDIYPENQRTTVIDTGYLSKGSFIGDFIPFTDWISEELDIQDKETGKSDGGRQIAWRMTANALKENIKDMYDGSVYIIGDPSIKPYDRIQMVDTYEDMSGMFEVETIIHSMNIRDGFITSVYPDCISDVDDRLSKREVFTVNSLVSKAIAPYLTYVGLSKLFNFDTKPLVNTSIGMLKAGTNLADGMIHSIGGLTKKDEFFRQISLSAYADKLGEAAGLSTANSAVLSKLNDLKSWNRINKLDDAMIRSNMVYFAKGIGDTGKRLDFTETMMDINDSIRKDLNADNIEVYKKAKEELKGFKKDLNKVVNKKNPLVNVSSNDLNRMFDSIVPTTSTDYKSYEKIQRTLARNWDDCGPVDRMKGFKEFIENMNAVPDVDISKSDDLKRWFKSINEYFEIITPDIDDVARTIRNSDDILKVGKLTLKGAKGLKAILSTVSGVIIEEAICYCITKYVDEFFSRELRNLQVLQIYPLRKDNKPYTSGLNGSKGLVVGSSTYNDEGIIESWVGNFFDKEQHGDLFNFVRDIFVGGSKTEQVMNNILENRKNTQETKKINNMISSLVAKEVKTGARYDQELLLNRFNILSTDSIKELNEIKKQEYIDDMKSIQKLYSITSSEELNSNNLNKMIPIQDTEIMNYKFFKLGHNESINEREIQDVNSLMEYKGKTIEISGFKVTKGDNTFYDYPLLNVTAFSILKEIVERYALIKKEKDAESFIKAQSLFDNFSDSYLTLTGALRISEVPAWNSTGLIFTLKTYSKKEIVSVLDEMLKENNQLNNLMGRDIPLFSYEVTDKGQNSAIIKVIVNPSGVI